MNGTRDSIITGGFEEVNDCRFEYSVAVKRNEGRDAAVLSFRLALTLYRADGVDGPQEMERN